MKDKYVKIKVIASALISIVFLVGVSLMIPDGFTKAFAIMGFYISSAVFGYYFFKSLEDDRRRE